MTLHAVSLNQENGTTDDFLYNYKALQVSGAKEGAARRRGKGTPTQMRTQAASQIPLHPEKRKRAKLSEATGHDTDNKLGSVWSLCEFEA